MPILSGNCRTRFKGSILLLLAALALPAATAGAAEIYRWVDADGVVQFSDSKPAGQSAETVVLDDSTPSTQGAPPSRRVIPAAASRPPDIRMYISPTCGFCIKADRYFKQRGLRYRSIDITASERNYADFKRRGGTGTPLIYIDGQRLSGFSATRLDQMLAGE